MGNEAWDDYRISKVQSTESRSQFEIDFGANGAIGAIVANWDLILFG